MQFVLSEEVKEKLGGLGVAAVYLFGSRAQGLEGPLSDYDLGVLMEPGHKRGDVTYDTLYDLFAPLLCPRTLESDILDIVFVADAPLELRFHVVRYGKVLFDADPQVRGRFEERTIKEYCDFRPILDMFDRAIQKSI